MEARIQTGALPAVGWSVLFAPYWSVRSRSPSCFRGYVLRYSRQTGKELPETSLQLRRAILVSHDNLFGSEVTNELIGDVVHAIGILCWSRDAKDYSAVSQEKYHRMFRTRFAPPVNRM
jgi:hypothetical protein